MLIFAQIALFAIADTIALLFSDNARQIGDGAVSPDACFAVRSFLNVTYVLVMPIIAVPV